MEHKGYLTAAGRITGDRSAAVAEVHYDEQRYNLRRVIVSRTWYVTLYPVPDGDVRRIRDRAIGAGATRREAISDALDTLARQEPAR